MNKYLIAIAFFCSLPGFSAGCDICGCGIGNNYIGILPDFHKKVFGLRYRYNSLLTHVGAGGANTYLTTNERYTTIEIWGGYNIGKKFRVMIAVPYNSAERFHQGIDFKKSGFGDVFLSGYFQAINNRKAIFTDKLLVQNLWVGAGVKVPAGKYDPMDKSVTNQNTNLFQLGTGSTDFTIQAMYDIRVQDAGMNVSLNYKFNTRNKYDYAYGNKLNLTSQAYYKLRIKNKVTIAPNTGIQYEKSQKDTDGDFAVDVSGGNLLSATLGIEATFSKVSIGGNFQTPLQQSLGNGLVKANSRCMIHLSLAL